MAKLSKTDKSILTTIKQLVNISDLTSRNEESSAIIEKVEQFLSSIGSMQRRQWIYNLENQFGARIDSNENIRAIINNFDILPEGMINRIIIICKLQYPIIIMLVIDLEPLDLQYNSF